MTLLRLVPHPANSSAAIREVIAIPRRDGAVLSFAFRALGDRDHVRWPTPLPAGFSDGLWRHSCFEAFVTVAGQPSYIELNMAPSTRWAAYRFDGYRSGMTRSEASPKRIRWHAAASDTLRAAFVIPDLASEADWMLGLSAVIELLDGTRLYFALAHPPGNPDFHNRDCFIATLPAPAAP